MTMTAQTLTTPRHVSAGQGVNIPVFGADHLMLSTGVQTNGSCAQFEAVVPPQGGPFPHVHHREDETFYVLEGEFAFHVNGEVIQAKTGDYVYAPRHVPHMFRNVGATPGKLLVTVTPAGLEEFFAHSSRILAADPTNMETVIALAERYGLAMVSPDQL